MRILHITNNYPTDKLPIFGIFVKEQIESLVLHGISNDVMFINGRENGKLEYIRAVFRIRRNLSKENYDIIHCHHALSSLCLILSGKSKENRVVVSFQNDPIHELGKVVFQFIKSNTNAWIFKNNSKLITDEYSFYLPNGVNTKLFKPMDRDNARHFLGLNKETIYILFVSSNLIRRQKRYDRFTETLKILKEKYNYNNIKELRLINTSREKIPYYFSAVDLHLLTSDFEGSPNSVKESLACNTPVVSTNVGNVEEILRGLDNNYVAKNNSAEELAFLVNLVLKGKKINSADHLIKLKLDMKSVAEQLTNIYKKISK
ncbi:glycosyltransferase family 4 protein [Sediminicola sp. 1XM1-17]|uniref:glycosyltransferase family 4 protein n=1 Tax=Sediminicola sp. 1XM1-17 TaxID=3127702 RepID=UPI003077DD0E